MAGYSSLFTIQRQQLQQHQTHTQLTPDISVGKTTIKHTCSLAFAYIAIIL